MRYVGRWIESLKDAVFPAPHELVGEYDANIRQRVVDYLQAGYTLRLYRGHASCLFACGFTLPHSELTDGKWVWPCNLAHYVEYHNVRVPPEFVTDAIEDASKPTFNKHWVSEEVDFSYWIQWCQEAATGHLRSRIQSALAFANMQAAKVLAAKAQEMEREHGLSAVKCNWAGCTRLALSHKALCAHCSLKGSEDRYTLPLFAVDAILNG